MFIGEPSVYWFDAQLSRDIVVLATDTIEVNNDRYKTHLKRWEMEESRREIRLAIAQSLWSRLDGWWRCTILSQSHSNDERSLLTTRRLERMDTWQDPSVDWHPFNRYGNL